MFGVLTQTVAPSVEPVAVDEARDHLRIDTTDDDALLQSYIIAARTHAENITNRQLVRATFTLKFDQFPAFIVCPRPPLSSVTSITYTDTAGDTQTFSSDSYSADTNSDPGRIDLAYGESWPSTRGDHNNIVVTFVAGYGTAATDVPEPIRVAMLMMVGHWYENREAVADVRLNEVPFATESLLWPYRVLEV